MIEKTSICLFLSGSSPVVWAGLDLVTWPSHWSKLVTRLWPFSVCMRELIHACMHRERVIKLRGKEKQRTYMELILRCWHFWKKIGARLSALGLPSPLDSEIFYLSSQDNDKVWDFVIWSDWDTNSLAIAELLVVVSSIF